MRNFRYIVMLVFLLLGKVGVVFSQDYARMSERTIMGTARYVGMGGAMTAIGGDPSSVFDNPAGLGLYQRSEVLVTFDETLDYTRQVGVQGKNLRAFFMCPQASLIFSVPTWTSNESGIQSYNFMLGYRRIHSYNRTYDAVGTGGISLGSLLPALDIPFCTDPTNNGNSFHLNEWGYVNEYSFDWSMNIGHRWYVGLGIHVQDYLLSSDAIYKETFDTINAEGMALYNRNSTTLQLSGVSCNFSVGVIYRPLQWLRLGLGFQTPTLGSLHTYTDGKFSALTDSLRYSIAPELAGDEKFHLPLHLSSSVAFQFGAYGMLSLQYDFLTRVNAPATHSLRAGLEVIPVLGLYINAGYAYESTFKPATAVVPMDPTFDRQDTYYLNPRYSQYASFAIGYRGTHMIVQAAYQYRWQRINLYAHEASQPYNSHADTHRIVLTFGWHQR